MALQVSKVAWIEVCLRVSQTTHDLYGLNAETYDCGSGLSNDTPFFQAYI